MPKDKSFIVQEVTSLVLSRRSKLCNIIEYKDKKVIYKRYASLYFIAGVQKDANELLVLELIQRYVETLDKCFGNVCELDLIFNFQKAYYVLDELLITGEIQETSKKAILKYIHHQDSLEAEEQALAKAKSRIL